MLLFDGTIKTLSNERLARIEEILESDVLFYFGPIYESLLKYFRDFLEDLQKDVKKGSGGKSKAKKDRALTIILKTDGGSANAAEKMVEMMRYFYDNVYFMVPDQAMSAGTILCMAGNKIYMDYSSSLGPIDPQVHNGKRWVPAMGYLDQIERILKKAEDPDYALTSAEVLFLQRVDLAELSQFDQARNLTITLLKRWLVKYKFADWTHHETNPKKKGQPVTAREKSKRAEEIAKKLGNHTHWHSHGRLIGMQTLRDELRLKIEDFGENETLRLAVREYNDLLIEYIERSKLGLFLHSRKSFNVW